MGVTQTQTVSDAVRPQFRNSTVFTLQMWLHLYRLPSQSQSLTLISAPPGPSLHKLSDHGSDYLENYVLQYYSKSTSTYSN